MRLLLSAAGVCASTTRSIRQSASWPKARSAIASNAGATLGTVYCRDESKAEEAVQRIQAAYEIGDQSPTEIPHLLREVINE